MKKLGLVGGTGPESTLMYYKELNSRIDKLTSGRHMPDIVIESVDFRRAWEYVSEGQYDLLTEYLAEKVDCLKSSGADVISLTAVTMHIVADEIMSKTGVSLISIPQAVSKEAASRGYRKIGLLGTLFTMEQDYMKKDFLEAGIEVFVPEKDDRELIAKRILEELELGIVKDSTLREFQTIIEKMREDQGIEAVVLGCTELPILLNSENCPLPILDSVEIHINELIKQAMHMNENIPQHILEMEAILDNANKKIDTLKVGLKDYEDFQTEIKRLETYYTSQQWKDDFEIDEKGGFPENLKRGVLSEDGIYNLLERNKELLDRIKSEEEINGGEVE